MRDNAARAEALSHEANVEDTKAERAAVKVSESRDRYILHLTILHLTSYHVCGWAARVAGARSTRV